MRILVVEDEIELADAIAVGLRREGYAVDTSPDGEEALDKVSYTAYDLICLDLNLPGIDGLEVCRRITWLSTEASPIPASSTRSPGCTGSMWPSSSATRSATTAFSLVVVTNIR